MSRLAQASARSMTDSSTSDILARMTKHATSSLAIAEIAGRDSIAAAIAATHERGFERIVPTIGFTGTEIGDFAAPIRAVERLKELLGTRVEILEPVELRDEALWAALNTTYALELSNRFGVCSPCLACHLYFHLLRVRMSWDSGGVPVIAGERDTHDGRIKLSQTTASINAAIRILAHGDVELLQPIRESSGETVAALVGGTWVEGGAQLGCEHSGNYTDPDGSVRYDQEGYGRYLTEFYEPAGKAIIDAWRANRAPDYSVLVRATLDH